MLTPTVVKHLDIVNEVITACLTRPIIPLRRALALQAAKKPLRDRLVSTRPRATPAARHPRGRPHPAVGLAGILRPTITLVSQASTGLATAPRPLQGLTHPRRSARRAPRPPHHLSRRPIHQPRRIPPACRGPDVRHRTAPRPLGRHASTGALPQMRRHPLKIFFHAPLLSLTQPVAVFQGRGGVGPAMPAQRILDVPDAAVDCTESAANEASTPARGPQTRCPAPAAAGCPALTRSAANCSPPPLGRSGGAQQGAQQRCRPFVQRPGHQQGAHRRFHTRGMLRPQLVEAQQLFHFFEDEFHLPPGAIDIQHIGRRPTPGVQRGDEQQPARDRQRGGRDVRPALGLAPTAAPGPLGRRRIEWRPPAAPHTAGPPTDTSRPLSLGAVPVARQRRTLNGVPASVSRGNVAGCIRTITSACCCRATATLRR